MADFIVMFKKYPEKPGVDAWVPITKKDGLTSDAAGAQTAIETSYEGPGRYAALRADNSLTAEVLATPAVTADSTPTY